jgi:hypothetical protein
MIIALVAFPVLGDLGRLWVQKGRISAIPVFGYAQHSDEIMEFIGSLRAKLETCISPEHSLQTVRQMLDTDNYILRLTEFCSLPHVASLGALPAQIDFEVEELSGSSQTL